MCYQRNVQRGSSTPLHLAPNSFLSTFIWNQYQPVLTDFAIYSDSKPPIKTVELMCSRSTYPVSLSSPSSWISCTSSSTRTSRLAKLGLTRMLTWCHRSRFSPVNWSTSRGNIFKTIPMFDHLLFLFLINFRKCTKQWTSKWRINGRRQVYLCRRAA